jgi:RHS repeat-associated protein
VNYTEYEYDFRNRMTRVTQYSKAPSEGGIILHEESYRHDALGRRVQVVSDGEETISVYNGKSFMANEWARFDASGEVFQRFLFTNNVDQLVAQWTQGEGISWALTDHLGSIRDTINDTGQIVQHIHYSAFGAPTFASPVGNTHPLAFTGRVWDGISRMSFHRARFYDVTTGRFTSIDQVGFDANDMNLFRYGANSPTLQIDLDGNTATLGYAIKVGLISGALLSPTAWVVCKIAIGESGDITLSKVAEKAVVGAILGAAIKAVLFKAGAYLQLVFLSNMSQSIPKVGPVTLTTLKIWLKNCSFLEIVGGL